MSFLTDLDHLEAKAGEAARLLKNLANTQRLILLCHLSEGECSVGELAEYGRLTQSATSQHLSLMREQGILTTRRDAQTIYYRLNDPATQKLVAVLCEIYRPAQN